MKRKIISFTLLTTVVASAALWQGCHGKIHVGCGGPMHGSEPTTMMLVFRNINNAADLDTAIWTNYNPNGSTASVDNSRAHLTLSANSSYHVQVYVLNLFPQQGQTSTDITPSVVKESSSYLVCFDESTSFYGNLSNSLNWVREDLDNSPSPMQLGLADSFWTGSDSTVGILQASLRHQYKVKTGDCSPGYSDIEALDTVYISPNKGK